MMNASICSGSDYFCVWCRVALERIANAKQLSSFGESVEDSGVRFVRLFSVNFSPKSLKKKAFCAVRRSGLMSTCTGSIKMTWYA